MTNVKQNLLNLLEKGVQIPDVTIVELLENFFYVDEVTIDSVGNVHLPGDIMRWVGDDEIGEFLQWVENVG